MAIIRSLLDTDQYKFTMGQYVFHQHPKTRVTYRFKCRTPNVLLALRIDTGRLKEEFDHVLSLTLSQHEIAYLASFHTSDGQRIFKEDFLNHLSRLRLPQYYLEEVDGNFRIEFEGTWAETILWETFCLSIINELYYKSITKAWGPTHIVNNCLVRLELKKVHLLGLMDLKLFDFSTRRRFSRLVQEIIIDNLRTTMPRQLVGTSNVYLAKAYDLKPVGTMAHELDMAIQGIILKETGGDFSQLVHAHDRVMDGWEREYGYDLRIDLPDTFGSDWAFTGMTPERMHRWKGERQDSGNPFDFADKCISMWQQNGITPKSKMIIFSDGLESQTIRDLYTKYNDQTRPAFGWGTNLGNDVGFDPISIVVKLVKADGYNTFKLSDTISKAIGRPEDIEKAKKVFRYKNTYDAEIKY